MALAPWRWLSPQCTGVILALTRLVLADPARPVPGPQGEWIIVPIDSSYVACMDDPSALDALQAVRPDARDPDVKFPKLVHEVHPRYPAGPLHDRVQGIVTLETKVSLTGCPIETRVFRLPHPSLGGSALQAVSGWRFTPGNIDGKPSPVVVKIELTFQVK